jgi:hypothetical protein
MKSISKILLAIALLLSSLMCDAQIKNAKTETVKIYGNCDMCRSAIQKAGNLKKVATVTWNKDTKMAMLTYNPNKTNKDEILKRIALAGYDSDFFLAPDDAYNQLPGCCQYERVKKTAPKMEESKMKMDSTEHSMHSMESNTEKQEMNQLKFVFDNYFDLKDALVQTDGASASLKSKELLNAIKAIKMEDLSMDVHTVWMAVLKNLQEKAKNISDAKDVADQRNHFISLSKDIYSLMKVAKYEQTVYHQFCPMANGGKGANWLSKEKDIENPYYGSQMLSCGKTVETLK